MLVGGFIILCYTLYEEEKHMSKKEKKREEINAIDGAKKSIWSFTKGILTIIIVFSASVIAYKQYKLYQLQVSPHFNAFTVLLDDKVEGKYSTHDLIIKNQGGHFYKITAKEISFIVVSHLGEKIRIPINTYFGASGRVLKEDIVYRFYGFQNNLATSRLYDSFNIKKETPEYSYEGEELYVKVIYQNGEGYNCVQYFNAENSELINNDLGRELYDEHERGYGQLIMKDIQSLTIDDIMYNVNQLTNM